MLDSCSTFQTTNNIVKTTVVHIPVDLPDQSIINSLHESLQIAEQNQYDVLVAPLMHSDIFARVPENKVFNSLQQFMIKQNIKVTLLLCVNKVIMIRFDSMQLLSDMDCPFDLRNNYLTLVHLRSGEELHMHVSEVYDNRALLGRMVLSGELCGKNQIVFDYSSVSSDQTTNTIQERKIVQYVEKTRHSIVWARSLGIKNGRVFSGASMIAQYNSSTKAVDIIANEPFKALSIMSDRHSGDNTVLKWSIGEWLFKSLKFFLERRKATYSAINVIMCMDETIEACICAIIAAEVFHPFKLFFYSVPLSEDNQFNNFMRKLIMDSNVVYFPAIAPEHNVLNIDNNLMNRAWSYCLTRFKAAKMHRTMMLEHRNIAGDVETSDINCVALLNSVYSNQQAMTNLIQYVKEKYGDILPEKLETSIIGSSVVNGPNFSSQTLGT